MGIFKAISEKIFYQLVWGKAIFVQEFKCPQTLNFNAYNWFYLYSNVKSEHENAAILR